MTAKTVSGVADLASGKDHTRENFPVASILIAPRHRAPVLSFYRFARAADDVADNPYAEPDRKLELLEAMRATLAGERDGDVDAMALRRVQDERGIDAQHGLDLLEAFRRDVAKLRYDDWPDLMDYCRYSAAPVGRFVLDVHGEDRASWPANDALCTALQVINHLQDCGKDYLNLDRVYVPKDALAAAGVNVEALGEPVASPALRRVIADLARQTAGLLRTSAVFSSQIRDRRLALEVAVIQRLGEDLNGGLMRRDPLSEPVHHGKAQAIGLALAAAAGHLFASGRRR